MIADAEDERTGALYEMVRYHLGLDREGPRGKRIRPLLGLLAYESMTGEHQRRCPGAAAVELGHNFSLVHDDIEDRDVERRHRATLWTVWGVAQAHQHRRHALHAVAHGAPPAVRPRLLGRQGAGPDAPLRRDVPRPVRGPVHGHLERRARRAAVGRLLLRHDRPQDRRADRRVGRRPARCWPPTTERIIDAYRGFGWSLGLAFQLNDDLLGIWGDEQATGKEPSDLAKHKKTLPLIYALEHAPAADRDAAARVVRDAGAVARPTSTRRAASSSGGAREYTRERARAERDEALAQLESAGVVDAEALERLRLIVVSAISA